MPTKPTYDPDWSDSESDNDVNANDNHKPEPGQQTSVAAALRGSTALASLAALGTVLNAVDTASVVGRSGLPMLTFKKEGDGTWSFGQRKTIPEDDSRWAVNPTSFKWGFICFNNDNKPTERLVPVSQPKPDVTELPDTGFEWHEQWAVSMKCLSGTDAGTEVVYKPTTVGGVQAIAGLIEVIRDRLNGGQHEGRVSPIVLLEKDSYLLKPYGRVWTPQLTIIDWMPLAGPAPAPVAPPPSSPPPEQPRRRRVA